MKFKQRFKEDKKFKFIVILISLFILSLFISSSPEKKEWTPANVCSENVNYEFGIFKNVDKLGCVDDGCFVVYDEGIIKIAQDCVPCGDVGAVLTDPTGCCDGKSSEVGDGWWRCSYTEPGQQCSGTLEKSISDMLIQVFPSMSCKSRYYVTLFGGGMLLLIAIL